MEQDFKKMKKDQLIDLCMELDKKLKGLGDTVDRIDRLHQQISTLNSRHYDDALNIKLMEEEITSHKNKLTELLLNNDFLVTELRKSKG